MKKHKENGFSMIELLISMAIFSLLAGAIGGVYVSTSRTSTLQNASAGVQQNVRAALEIMVQDIRMAGYDPTGSSKFGIPIKNTSKIQVTSDRWIDDDPEEKANHPNGDIDEVNGGFEQISYERNGNDLRRILYEDTGIESTETIIENVTDLQFTYPVTNPSIVDITLTVEENAGYGNTVSRTLETRVYCRNLDIN